MNISLLTDRGVAKFGTKVGIEMNNTKYSSNQPWLLELCEPDDVGVYVPNITLPQLKNSHGKTHYDSENAFIFYKSTKNLNLYEAADVRLWSSLAHFTYWDYMKSRWPIDGNKNFEQYILEHYWFSPSGYDKKSVRNGISRLWWYGFLVASDDDELTKKRLNFLLNIDLDITQSLLERSVSRTKNVRLAIIDGLIDLFDNKGEKFNRLRFRNLMMQIHSHSSAQPLAFLSYENLFGLVQSIWNESLEDFPESSVKKKSFLKAIFN